MERTKITYRGRVVAELGHTGTFFLYILYLLFGCGWFGLGIDFISDGVSAMSLIAIILGLIFISASLYGIYDNRKEVFDKKKVEKESKRIESFLLNKKNAQRPQEVLSTRTINQHGKEIDIIVDDYIWNTMKEIECFSLMWRNTELDLILKIFEGLNIDSYDFELKNNLINDRYIRGQKVITIKGNYFVPANTILTIEGKGFDLMPGNKEYFCRCNERRVVVNESDIIDYKEWLTRNNIKDN